MTINISIAPPPTFRPYDLGDRVTARIDGTDRPAEIRGHCHKGADLYDVMTADRTIHCYLRAEHLSSVQAIAQDVDAPVLRIGRTR
jgi:hypothetical protein